MTESAGSAALAEGNPEDTPATEGTQEAAWYGEHEELVAAKGWKSPTDALDSYKNLEKLVGGDKVALPKSEDDVAAWDQLYNKIGRPASPEEYKAEVPIDGEIVKQFAAEAHKMGLTQKQYEGLLGFYSNLEGGAVEKANQAFLQRSETEMGELQKEKGATFDQFKVDAKRGVKELGLSGDELESLERVLGTKKMMNLLARQGMYLREDTMDGEPVKSLMSPAAARAEMSRLRQDKMFMDAYMDGQHVGHKDAVAKMERLTKFAVGKAD